MRLIEISANHASFKTVRFNPVGASLIIGSRKEDAKLDGDSRSYNGVGKSLLVEIIHFCLGANANPSFRDFLGSWEFYLRFEVNGRDYVARRACGKPAIIFLNEVSYKQKEFNELLGKLCFDFPAWGGGQLSFRTLIPRFIRRSKADYNDPRLTSSDKEPYTVLVRNLFLLGVDVSLVESKYLLRSRQTELESFQKNFKTDPFIREYYTGNKDATLQARHLEEQIKRLESDLSTFSVAEDYYEIEQEANKLSAELRAIKNRKVVVENALENVKRSLQNKADIPMSVVLKVYEELKGAFRDEALRKLQDVESFHSKILANRIARLGQEHMRFDSERKALELQIHELSAAVDGKLGYLSDKRALDQYASVSAQVSDLKGKRQKLIDYQQLLHKSREDAAAIQIKMAEENVKTNNYLDEWLAELEGRFQRFSDLARKFYPDAPAGIVLSNNIGDNKIRYDFDVRIEADGSDGINAVKLFCYDFSVLVAAQNHSLKFLFHDSRLFSDIDPRQRAVLFSTACNQAQALGLQYIATVNQDQLDALRDEMAPDEFAKLMACEVLRLNDDGPSSKLLGIQVDMHY
jgi:uncharacterized protein YydD (DUF2326 family)